MHNEKGLVGMANKGKDSNGSQFYFTLDKCSHLDGKHVIFGKIIEGSNVLDEIERG